MENLKVVKGIIAGVGAYLSAKLGMLYVVIPLLLICMIVDYVTGMLAAKKEGQTNSKTGMWGIIKKTMYGVEVAVGVVVDWTIINAAEQIGVTVPTVTFFGLLVSIWIIINELISILENLTRLDTPMPAFLVKVVSNFKISIEKNGDKLAEQIGNSDNQE